MRHCIGKDGNSFVISIHASRVGCDVPPDPAVIARPISIHASRVGCDTGRPASLTDAQFQSTHPVWDATASASRISRRSSDFNPRIPCGMRPEINVHSDDPVYFNPRIPCGMRQATSYGCIVESISIHASRVGCDLQWHCSESGFSLFQSTHPVWDATRYEQKIRSNPKFQSTHPVWDATKEDRRPQRSAGISIHASRVGCDVVKVLPGRQTMISIHASRVGCDGLS